MSTDDKSASKFLSLVLRHKPEILWLHMDENGWARVNFFASVPSWRKRIHLPIHQNT
ncbi:MAG: hypothetical protein EOP49_30740 [Sphingobacteriales bacterium]|nr:MAG: hypothetical protein EOP49_30740 [Sphingobacteriales bacterium]